MTALPLTTWLASNAALLAFLLIRFRDEQGSNHPTESRRTS